MTMGPQRGARAAAPTGPGRGEAGPRGAAAGTNPGRDVVPATSAADAHDPDFRHSYSRDRAQLLRRLNRIEGQVRGIARMIEREEYCVDILQQTAALRAAIDAVSIMVLEDHVQGCVRTAAERGEADQYVDEVLDVVRRTLGRPIRSASRP
jgi:DNA-binding FrmR family transcriptional regulator